MGREPELSTCSGYIILQEAILLLLFISLSVEVKRLNWFLLLKVSDGSPRKSLVKSRKNFKKGRIICHFLDRNMFNPLVCDRVERDLTLSKLFHAMRMGA